jgi:hypothetical protein
VFEGRGIGIVAAPYDSLAYYVASSASAVKSTVCES